MRTRTRAHAHAHTRPRRRASHARVTLERRALEAEAVKINAATPTGIALKRIKTP